MDAKGNKAYPEEQTLGATAMMPVNASQEDEEQFNTLSHSPSPKLPSILIHPSDSGASRPRSSEGRINLPKDTLSRGLRTASMGLKKRSIGAQIEKEPSLKTDPFLNFGIGDDFPYTEDPLMLEDVQRALKVKARRSTQQHSVSEGNSQESHDSFKTSPVASPKSDRANVPTTMSSELSPSQYQPGLYVSSTRRTSSLSLQSNSSEELSSKSPIPILVSLPDGTSYLDWSGGKSLTSPQLKDKSFIGRRTFSLTKNKAKPRQLLRKGGSLDLRTSQGDLHVALLDSVRRIARRETSLKAEKTKEELNRRYSFLSRQKPMEHSEINILAVLRNRQDDTLAPPFWCSWRKDPPSQTSQWTITADNIDEYLCSTRSPTQSDANRPQSPAFRFSSLSSPRPSFSSSPGSFWKDTRQTDFNPSLSASITEVVMSSSRPTLSLNADTLPTSSKVSLQASLKGNADPVDRTVGLGDEKRDKSPTKTEGDRSFGRRLRASISSLAKDSTIPSVLSSKYNHVKGSLSTGGQRPGPGNSFDHVRRSGDERFSRSSISDERDSVRELNLSNRDLTNLFKKATSLTVPVDIHRHKPKFHDHGRSSNTSESETGIASPQSVYRQETSPPHRNQEGMSSIQGSLSAEERTSNRLNVSSWVPRHSVRQDRLSGSNNLKEESLNKFEEEEEYAREVYKRREQLLIEANDHNRKIARLLKGVCNSLRDYERTQVAFAAAGGSQYSPLPREVVEAINSDPATTLRHGKGWRAVEHSHELFHKQQAILTSHISRLTPSPPLNMTYRLDTIIETAKGLWENLQKASEQIESRVALVDPALNRAMGHVESVQKEYNRVQMLTETDYPENRAISDLETYILESQVPRGWLELAAIWIPVYVLEAIGGFIRFFGVPISEKFIRPLLWYFFRNRYYWKVYSTEPPPNQRAWYTRLAYWLIITSFLAWYVVPQPESFFDLKTDMS